jgi:hypothetical protein
VALKQSWRTAPSSYLVSASGALGLARAFRIAPGRSCHWELRRLSGRSHEAIADRHSDRGFCSQIRCGFDQSLPYRSPFATRCLRMAADDRTVDHVLPAIGQPEIDQCGEHRILDTLFGPTPETDIDRVLLPVALTHVAPGATDAQHTKHAVHEPPVFGLWTGFGPTL